MTLPSTAPAAQPEDYVVLDFETTGLSAGWDRPTEIALALVREGQVIAQFQQLMNPGRPIPSYVQELTGITNRMVATAPPVNVVMREAANFVGQRPLVAHNASFDRKFWQAELQALDVWADHAFACSMLLARRLCPDAPNHQLGTLARHLHLPSTGQAHRAMADVLMTVQVLQRFSSDLAQLHGLTHIDHSLWCKMQSTPKQAIPEMLRRLAAQAS
ncbi:MAG: hypothetical protein RLZZ612_463 [Pseudomonadota bacterium]